MGRALWLVPSPSSSAETAIQSLITSLSKAFSSPSFPPHITLASLPECISVVEIVEVLSSEEPLEVSFESVRTGQTYYQSVFIAIQSSRNLSQLHEHVHKTLGVQPKNPEFMHLSLYYGNEHRDVVMEEVKKDCVQPVGSSGITVAGVHKFLVKEIWVVDCRGRPEDWTVVEKVGLTIPEPRLSVMST